MTRPMRLCQSYRLSTNFHHCRWLLGPSMTKRLTFQGAQPPNVSLWARGFKTFDLGIQHQDMIIGSAKSSRRSTLILSAFATYVLIYLILSETERQGRRLRTRAEV